MKLNMNRYAFSPAAAKTDAQRAGQAQQMKNTKLAAMKANKNHDTLYVNGREVNATAVMKANTAAAMAKATYNATV
jgi:hypothetical protein